MQHWLVKSEPEAFSWDQQVANGVEPWTGVRSHQAKNNLRAMRLGDRAFFYHSNTGKEIVGVVEVVREAYPDPADEKWSCVDMKAVGPVPPPRHPGRRQGRPGAGRHGAGPLRPPVGRPGAAGGVDAHLQAGGFQGLRPLV